MILTVKELSSKLNVSKVSIYKHYNAINKNGKYDDYVTKKDDKLAFKQPLINIINNSFDKSHVNAKPRPDSDPKYITHLEIENKRLYESNKHLEKLLDQQQQLQLSTEHENKRLRSNNKHLKHLNGSVNGNYKSVKTTSDNKKTGFWHRFFNF